VRKTIGLAATAVLLLSVAGGTAQASPGPWRISTLAGGVGGPAPASQVAAGACALSFAGGDLYATSSGYDFFEDYFYYSPSVIRRISMRTGQLTTSAGSAYGGFARLTPSGTPAAQAAIGDSCGVASDPHGNLFFTDERDRVEMVPATTGRYFGQAMTAGHAYIIGGDGTDGFSGDGGPATGAEVSIPGGVTVDGAGNVIFDDSNNNRVRLIAATSGTFYGQAMTAGDIYTVAGGGENYAASGVPATSALLELADEGGEYPGVQPWPLVATDGSGNIVLADGGDAGAAMVEVVAGRTGSYYGKAMKAGDIYVLAGTGRKAPDGVPAGSASLGMTSGVTVDHAGNILASDASAHQLYVIAARTGRFYGRAMKAGYIYVLAGDGTEGFRGDGGPAARARFSGPDGVVVDSAGNVVVADGDGAGYDSVFSNNRLRVIAARAGRFYGVPMKAGDIYTISGARGLTFYGDGGPAGRALLDGYQYGQHTPDTGIAVTRSGGALFADAGNNRVRLVPAVTGSYFGRRLKAGDIYTIAGNGHPGYGGDRGLAARSVLSHPDGVAVDAAGDAVLSDTGNNRVRIVAASSGRRFGQAMTAGHIYTIAGTGRAGYSGNGGPGPSARLSTPGGIGVDHQGNLVVADTGNAKIRVIAARAGRYYGRAMTAGHIYTVASLPCVSVAVDPAGNLVAGCGSNVDVVAEHSGLFYGQQMVAGKTYSIASKSASASVVAQGVAVDGSGNVIIGNPGYGANVYNGLVMVVPDKSGTYYGVAMTAGHLYPIAGNGSGGLGDGGPAAQGRFNDPTGVAVAPSGAIYVLDINRIRVIRD
jgi:hypothetical protein